jgi:GH24 family phage-related lysozyme (muramidase)
MIKRNAIAALSLSAAALVGIATHEGYVGQAYRDIVGVWTIGFGTTEQVKAASMAERVLLVCAGLVGMYLLKKAGLM